jgi:hypothetical protein
MPHARDWIDVLQALLIPMVAVAAGGIAFAQWWTAKNKLKLDLFDRRWAVYVAVRELLSEIVRHANVSPEAQDKFLAGVRGARWLFDERVHHYIFEELYRRVTDLQAANAMLEPGAPTQQDQQSHVKMKWEICRWSAENNVDVLFGEFLQMDQRFSDWARAKWRRLAAWSRPRGKGLPL